MEFPGFYFCLCPDSTLARGHVTDLLAGQDGGPAMNVRTFWAEDGLDGQFWEALTLPDFMGKAKVLQVRGAQALPAETWKKLSAALATPRSGTVPIFFLESPWEKGQPKLPPHIARLRCLDFATKKGWVWKNPGLDARSLRRHIQAEAKVLGLTLESGALDALADMLAPDAAAVRGALEQLALAAPGATVSADLARQLAGHQPEIIIFDVIRHLQTGDTAAVWAALLHEGEELLFPLLALLTREARLLWQILAGENVFLPPHVAGMKRDLAAAMGTGGVASLLQAVMEAEWAVKSGRRQPAQALEALTAELTLIFRPKLRGARGRP